MDAPTFDNHSALCPICHRAGKPKPSRMFYGLLTCKHCQARLVVSWSGHYVRDPFRLPLRQLGTGQMLRRESRPVARILRDVGVARQSPLLAVLGSLAFLGVALTLMGTVNPQSSPLNKLVNQVTEVVRPPKDQPN